MAYLPNIYDIVAAQKSEWSSSFGLQDSNGDPMDITGKTFELVVRRSVLDTGVPLLTVSSQAATASGQIIVDVDTGSILVVVTPFGTGLLFHGGGSYSIWMNPGLSDATVMVTGNFFCNPVVNP